MKNHHFGRRQTDSITGKEWEKCLDCGAVYVQGDDWFNMYCPAQDLKIRGVIERAKAEKK